MNKEEMEDKLSALEAGVEVMIEQQADLQRLVLESIAHTHAAMAGIRGSSQFTKQSWSH